MKDRPLTPRQEKFIAAYLKFGNATKAAIAAGYSRSGADVQGQRLLGNAVIKKRIAGPLKDFAERSKLTAARVLEEMRRLAFVDPRRFWDERGNLKPIHELDEETAAALGGFEAIIKNAHAGDGVTDLVHKIKIIDKTKPLEMLGKHFKLLTDVVQVVDGDKMIARLNRGRDRVAKLRKG